MTAAQTGNVSITFNFGTTPLVTTAPLAINPPSPSLSLPQIATPMDRAVALKGVRFYDVAAIDDGILLDTIYNEQILKKTAESITIPWKGLSYSTWEESPLLVDIIKWLKEEKDDIIERKTAFEKKAIAEGLVATANVKSYGSSRYVHIGHFITFLNLVEGIEPNKVEIRYFFSEGRIKGIVIV